MEQEERKRVLVIISELELESIYTALLEHEYYELRIDSYSSKDDFLEIILNFHPHLIILHIDLRFEEVAFELLSNVRQSFEENERPRALCVLPRSWCFDSRITLADAYMGFGGREFRQKIEEFLQESSV